MIPLFFVWILHFVFREDGWVKVSVGVCSVIFMLKGMDGGRESVYSSIRWLASFDQRGLMGDSQRGRGG
jgi:hypothetical protein